MSIFLWSYSALIFSHQIAISDMCKLQFIIGYSRTSAVDLAAFAVCPWLFYYRLIRFPRTCGDAALASRLPVQKACTLVAPRDTTNCIALDTGPRCLGWITIARRNAGPRVKRGVTGVWVG